MTLRLFKAPSSRLFLDSWGDGADIMWEERSLVYSPRYTTVGYDADTEVTLEFRWRSVMRADVETSVYLCCHSWSYRPLPASPSCADLKNIHSECSARWCGCVLTLAWRYWLVAFRSISVHTLSTFGLSPQVLRCSGQWRFFLWYCFRGLIKHYCHIFWNDLCVSHVLKRVVGWG